MWEENETAIPIQHSVVQVTSDTVIFFDERTELVSMSKKDILKVMVSHDL
jgi:hypothetical protein